MWYGLVIAWKWCFSFVCMIHHVGQICSCACTGLAQYSLMCTCSAILWWCLKGFAGMCGWILLHLVGITMHPVWQGCLPFHYQRFCSDLVSTAVWPIFLILCTVCLYVSLLVLHHLENWVLNCQWLLKLTGNLKKYYNILWLSHSTLKIAPDFFQRLLNGNHFYSVITAEFSTWPMYLRIVSVCSVGYSITAP